MAKKARYTYPQLLHQKSLINLYMMLYFTKMHSLGNDFMVIDGIYQTIRLDAALICQLADRHRGIGFDQLLIIEKSNEPGVDFNYRIFNADGSEVGQCGNGARCLAHFAHFYGLTAKKQLVIATSTTRMTLTVHTLNKITVHLKPPQFSPSSIPMLHTTTPNPHTLLLDTSTAQLVYTVNVGNPHAVTCLSNLDDFDINNIGKKISQHPFFPQQCNAGFMQIQALDAIKLRVYERGAAETQACGSGAVAAVAVGRRYFGLDEKVMVNLPGGVLEVDWPDMNDAIYLTGEACSVFEGKINTALLG